MWTCPKCKRIFDRERQMHSCRQIPLDEHFVNKKKAKELFEYLLSEIGEKIGKFRIITLPCCIHLYGRYDFLAALPKKDSLEIRFALDRSLETPRLKVSVPLSSKSFKNCFNINSRDEIDGEFLDWIKQSYHFKD